MAEPLPCLVCNGAVLPDEVCEDCAVDYGELRHWDCCETEQGW